MPRSTPRHRSRAAALICALLGLCTAFGDPAPARGDVLLLKNGSRVEGTVDKVDRATGMVSLRTQDGLAREVRLADLKFDSWLKVMTAATPAGDARGWMDIALRCKREEEFDRARKFYEKALIADAGLKREIDAAAREMRELEAANLLAQFAYETETGKWEAARASGDRLLAEFDASGAAAFGRAIYKRYEADLASADKLNEKDGTLDISTKPGQRISVRREKWRTFVDPALQAKIDKAIKHGCEYLVSAQCGDGGYSYNGAIQKQLIGNLWDTGTTALCFSALLKSGFADTPAAEKALAWLLKNPITTQMHTMYAPAVVVMALTSEGDPKHVAEIDRLRNLIVAGENISDETMFGYPGGENMSTTQFALLGLFYHTRDSRVSGTFRRPPAEMWERLMRGHERAQNKDGGWSYNCPPRGSSTTKGSNPWGPNAGKSYGSMTVAGICDVIICRSFLEDELGGANEDLSDHDMVKKGLAWLEKNWAKSQNPGFPWGSGRNGRNGKPMLDGYFVYSLEKMGAFHAKKYIGKHNWYREVAEDLLEMQEKDGSWAGEWWGSSPQLATAYALLFLVRADNFHPPRQTPGPKREITYGPGEEPPPAPPDPKKAEIERLLLDASNPKRFTFIRSSAVMRLGFMGDPSAIAGLLKIVQKEDDYEDVRINAVNAIYKLGREEDLMTLVHAYAAMKPGAVKDELGSAIVTMKKEKR